MAQKYGNFSTAIYRVFQKKAAPKTEAATLLLHNIYLEKAYSCL